MDKSRFIICRAAAGSGKTYTLVRNYLELAFSARESELGSRFSHILAITFTKKAVNEMKERILRELDNMAARGAECPMGRDLGERMGLDSGTLQRYAETVRQGILHNYSDFAVMTIDSFVQHIVRTFAHDLGLPMKFNVNIDYTDLIQNAVDNLMALIGTEGEEGLTRVLCDFGNSCMAEGKSHNIELQLKEEAKELFKEQTPEYLEELKQLDADAFRSIHNRMREAVKEYEKQMMGLGQEGVEAIKRAGLTIKDFFQGASGAGGFFKKLAEGNFAAPNSYALAYLEEDKLGGGKATKETVEKLADLKPTLQEIYQRIKNLSDSETKLYNTRTKLLANLYKMALLNKMNEMVELYSKDNEIVHISEFNKRIAHIVQEEPAPFIYERIGNRYYNYLIDEFQDTSRMQWQNLVPLVENGVGAGHTSLVVGDGKQAIYRFRQGDVEQFASLPHVDSPLHGALLEAPGIGEITRLEKNFRTKRLVVEFNNGFFEWTVSNVFPENKEMVQIYLGENEEPDLKQKVTKEGGYVQIGFWDATEHTTLWQEMLTDIREQTEEKGYGYRDITILARDNKTLSEISTYLIDNGIPVISSEALLLTQSNVVMMMVSLLQYLIDGTDRVAAAKVLMYLRHIGKLKRDYARDFAASKTAVDLDEIVAREGLELNCSVLRSLGLYDCCEEALRMLHIQDVETAYTASWLDVAAYYANNYRYDLREFLDWFEQQKKNLSTNMASDLDAINLMTIHKAKGLEAPIVIYPILQERTKTVNIWVHIDPSTNLELPASQITLKADTSTLFDAERDAEVLKREMDDLNVLYVALTRPKEKLMLYCQNPSTGKSQSATKSYSNLLFDYIQQHPSEGRGRSDTYVWGENEAKHISETEEKKPANVELKEVMFPRWTNRIAIAEQAAAIFGELDETSQRRGTQVHDLLATIKHSGESSQALAAYISKNKIENNEAEKLEMILNNMLGDTKVARFFAPEYSCKNECSLVWNGEVLRPDRIVMAENETWVIDFKTGIPKAEHRLQVGRYCEAVQSMGYPCVKGYLLYIGGEKCQVMPCE